MPERDHLSVGIQQMVTFRYPIPRERDHDQLRVCAALKWLECGGIVSDQCIQIFHHQETTWF